LGVNEDRQALAQQVVRQKLRQFLIRADVSVADEDLCHRRLKLKLERKNC